MKLDYIFAIGIIAQILFSLRLLIQWWQTEKAQRIQTPTIFWILSLVASFLLIVYGVLRKDIVIVGGQLISYYIYIRNLQIKQSWQQIPPFVRHLFVVMPMIAMFYLIYFNQLNGIIHNDEIPRNVLIWGSAGQAIFTLRFVYQWFASEKQKKSVLPISFWFISLVGSIMIISYGVLRKDLVLIIGQLFGLVIYLRNIMIYYKNHPHELQLKK